MTGKKRLLQTYGILCVVMSLVIMYVALKLAPFIGSGDVMAVLYTNREESLDTAGELYLESVQIDEVKPELPQLIVDIIR